MLGQLQPKQSLDGKGQSVQKIAELFIAVRGHNINEA